MFTDLVREMDGVMFDEFGQKVVYNDAVIVEAILEFDVMRYNSMGESVRNHYEFTVSNREVGTMKVGDIVEVGRERYRISEIVLSDESVTVGAAVRESG